VIASRDDEALFRRVGDAYVNDAYGESDITLNVAVQGGDGEINLQVV
jgi:hypothetical protein